MTDMELFDFDCNMTHEDLRDHVTEHMTNAKAVGVTEMLVPGAHLDESEAALRLCRQDPAVRWTSALTWSMHNANETHIHNSISFLRQVCIRIVPTLYQPMRNSVVFARWLWNQR